jgi:hypothetical protein
MSALADEELEDARQALEGAREGSEPHAGLRIAANEYINAARKFDEIAKDLNREKFPRKGDVDDNFVRELACLEVAVTLFSEVGDKNSVKDYLKEYIDIAEAYDRWICDNYPLDRPRANRLGYAVRSFIEPYGARWNPIQEGGNQ